MVFVALCVAAAALEGRRRLEDVPQRPRAGVTGGGEVVQGGDEFVALVADVVWTFIRCRFDHHFLIAFTLAFVGVQDLIEEK